MIVVPDSANNNTTADETTAVSMVRASEEAPDNPLTAVAALSTFEGSQPEALQSLIATAVAEAVAQHATELEARCSQASAKAESSIALLQQQLADTQRHLAQQGQILSTTVVNLNATELELMATKVELKATNDELKATRGELQVTRNGLYATMGTTRRLRTAARGINEKLEIMAGSLKNTQDELKQIQEDFSAALQVVEDAWAGLQYETASHTQGSQIRLMLTLAHLG